MGTVIVKIKIMPVSLETDIKKIEEEIKEVLIKNKVGSFKFEIQPIAFGLNAIILIFGWPEEKELERFEGALKKTHGVGSVSVLDMRRAIG